MYVVHAVSGNAQPFGTRFTTQEGALTHVVTALVTVLRGGMTRKCVGKDVMDQMSGY